MFSVVIPLYNKRDTIARALDSVRAQTLQDFEVIVVDDGSTDGGADVVRSYADPRIRLVQQPNAGVSAARNAGIAAARSDTVALLDADDEWKPEFLETIQGLQRDFPEAAVWATNYEFARSNGTVVPTRIRGLPHFPWRGVLRDYFAVACRSDPPLNSSAVAALRAALQSVGGFPVGLRSGEDLLTWARLASRFRVAYDSRALSRFYFPETLSSRTPRHDSNGDGLIEGLARLAVEIATDQQSNYTRYCALVHAMRAEVFIQQGPRRLALAHCGKAIRLDGFTAKLVMFIGLSLLPHGIGALALRCARRASQCLRVRGNVKTATKVF